MKNNLKIELSFFQKLFLLGAKFGDDGEHVDFIDLECFFLESTNFMNKDARLSIAILHWIWAYAVLLSPSKIRREIKANSSAYNSKILDYFLEFLSKKKLIHKNWEILKPYCKKLNIKGETFLFIPHYFKPNPQHYLRPFSWIKKNCPELFFRMMGLDQVTSDIQSALTFREFKTLYELSVHIKSPRNRVNEVYRQLEKYETLTKIH